MTSYISLTEANAFMAELLNSEAWDSSQDADKQKALNEATMKIDTLNFIGKKTSENQENEFPRGGDSVVPSPIKQACALIAQSLLDGVDTEEEIRNLSAVSQGYASVRTTYDRSFVPEYLSAGIPSATAWMLIKPYLIDPRNILLIRAT